MQVKLCIYYNPIKTLLMLFQNENKVRDINCSNCEGLTPLLLATRDMAMLEKLSTQSNRPYHPAEVVAELLQYRW
jgi:hypothetical protein